MIGCDCRVCRSADPRDRRTRPSILIERLGHVEDHSQSSLAAAIRSILVDTSTDLRAQALAHDIRRVDAILFTHSHADHILGLDEVRRFNAIQGGPIACYGTRETWETLHRTFYYIFDGLPRKGGGIPQLVQHEITGPFAVGGVHILP